MQKTFKINSCLHFIKDTLALFKFKESSKESLISLTLKAINRQYYAFFLDKCRKVWQI